MNTKKHDLGGFVGRLFKVQPFFWLNQPINPNTVPFIDDAPDGLRQLYTAPTPVEADLLRQVLLDAGFHIEYVPQTTMGIFGVRGSTLIYVKSDQYDQALEFLNEYLNAAPEEPPSS